MTGGFFYMNGSLGTPPSKQIKSKKASYLFNFRKDGTLLHNIDPMRKLLPYLFRSRNGSIVYSPEIVEFDNARDYIKEKNKQIPGLKLGTFEVVIAALLRTMTLYPYLNRFVAGKKLFARNSVYFSFVVLKMINGNYEETNAKIEFEKTDTIYDVAKKVNSHIELCQSGELKDDDKLLEFVSKLPSPLITFVTFVLSRLNNWGLLPPSYIKTDPLYSSAYISNLGSIGHDSLHHHLYEWGTTSVFITMGKLNKENEIQKDGTSCSKTQLNLVCSIDERIADGIYLVKALKTFKDLIKHPEKLENPPDTILEDDGI
jgi:hypothetical protein